jgi:hypothetical protein
MLKTISILLALTAAAFAQDSARDEAQVWNLEKAYWEYVKANDLEKYRTLWHEDFLGCHTLVRRRPEKITSPIGSP